MDYGRVVPAHSIRESQVKQFGVAETLRGWPVGAPETGGTGIRECRFPQTGDAFSNKGLLPAVHPLLQLLAC